jgi:hypothetical protein
MFPLSTRNDLFKKWIHAIRRDEGKDFKINAGRHFRENDLKKTLAGKIVLNPGVVPSVFPWIRTSPRKRKPPTERLFTIEPSSSDSRNDDLSDSEEQAEVIEIPVAECVTQVVGTQTDLTDQEVYLTEVITSNRKEIQALEHGIIGLKSQIEDCQRRNEILQSRLFTIDTLKSNNTAVAFYTGFPNWETFMSTYRYLEPGEQGKNINYWQSSDTVVSADYDENESKTNIKKGRARTLR